VTTAVRATQLGHQYQHRQFWIEACELFIGNSPVQQVGLECGSLRAFADRVTEYASAVPDDFLRDIAGDHYRCKFHVSYAREVVAQDLAEPALIGATKVSLVERLANATRAGGMPRRMTLITPHRVSHL
jgi:hypothetical protein